MLKITAFSYGLAERRHCVRAAAEEETVEAGAEQQPTGLLAGVSVAVVLLLAAAAISAYMYSHPTSSVSLFFMEVSLHDAHGLRLLRRTIRLPGSPTAFSHCHPHAFDSFNRKLLDCWSCRKLTELKILKTTACHFLKKWVQILSAFGRDAFVTR